MAYSFWMHCSGFQRACVWCVRACVWNKAGEEQFLHLGNGNCRLGKASRVRCTLMPGDEGGFYEWLTKSVPQGGHWAFCPRIICCALTDSCLHSIALFPWKYVCTHTLTYTHVHPGIVACEFDGNIWSTWPLCFSCPFLNVLRANSSPCLQAHSHPRAHCMA